MEEQASRPVVQPILEQDVERAAAFLHAHLNPRVPIEAWVAVLRPPWSMRGPNRGFQLLVGGEIVGVYAAVYSRSSAGTDPPDTCNLAAFCVREPFRAHSLRLMRAVLAQQGYLFTDLSPSGNVPAINERLGFTHLDTSTRLVLNLPWFGWGPRVTDDPETVAALLKGDDAAVYDDLRDAPAARHLVVHDAGRYAYLVYRRDRRKRLGVFASPLHVGGDPAVLEAGWQRVASHLVRRGLLVTLAERRILHFTPRGIGRDQTRPRPKMFRGDPAAASGIGYLYSELTLLSW